MKLILTICLMAIATGVGFGQMTDAKFVGFKGKVKSVWTERSYTEAIGDQRLNHPDKKGYLTRSSSFSKGESRLLHSFVGGTRRVDRYDFDTSKRALPVNGLCSLPVSGSSKMAERHFDYFYKYRYDSRKRISGVTQYCDANTTLMESVFQYNNDGRIISDVRCNSRSNTCDNDYYQYSGKRMTQQKTTSTVKGVEMCVSVTIYSGWQLDKKGNEIKRAGVTTDCSDPNKVFYRFIDTTTIDYY